MLYVEDLNAMHCSEPGCDHVGHQGLYLNGKCHPGGAVKLVYESSTLTVICADCKAMIGKIAVAKRYHPEFN